MILPKVINPKMTDSMKTKSFKSHHTLCFYSHHSIYSSLLISDLFTAFQHLEFFIFAFYDHQHSCFPALPQEDLLIGSGHSPKYRQVQVPDLPIDWLHKLGYVTHCYWHSIHYFFLCQKGNNDISSRFIPEATFLTECQSKER